VVSGTAGGDVGVSVGVGVIVGVGVGVTFGVGVGVTVGVAGAVGVAVTDGDGTGVVVCVGDVTTGPGGLTEVTGGTTTGGATGSSCSPPMTARLVPSATGTAHWGAEAPVPTPGW